MNKEFDDSEKIEAYLRNDLSPTEKAEFEERISRDPLLQNELTLQQDIIASLQDFRKAELKARLNRVDLTEGQATGMNLFLYIKAAGLLAFVAMLGYGGMWLLNRPESSKSMVIETPADKPAENPAQPQVSLTDSQPQPANETISKTTETTVPADKLSGEAEKSVQPASKPERNARPSLKTTEPTGSKAIRPENQSEDKQHEAAGSSTKHLESNAEVKSSNADEKKVPGLKKENDSVIGGKISSESSKAPSGLNITYNDSPYKFHYTNRGHLSLYGDFSKGYKIVQLNTREYLSFDSNYYFIEPNQIKVSPLIKVTDEELINQLRNLDEQE